MKDSMDHSSIFHSVTFQYDLFVPFHPIPFCETWLKFKCKFKWPQPEQEILIGLKAHYPLMDKKVKSWNLSPSPEQPILISLASLDRSPLPYLSAKVNPRDQPKTGPEQPLLINVYLRRLLLGVLLELISDLNSGKRIIISTQTS